MPDLTFTYSDLLIIPAVVLSLLHGSYFAFFHSGRIANLVSALFLLLSGFLLLNLDSTFNFHPFVFFLLLRMAILIPAVLWLLTFNLFSDEGQVTWRFYLFLAVYFLLETIGTSLSLWSSIEPESSIALNIGFDIIPQLAMIGLAVHSLILALRGYYSDLIQSRRVARLVFVVCIAILVLLVLANGILASINSLALGDDSINQAFPDVLIAAYILVLMVGFNLSSFTLRDDVGLLVSLPFFSDVIAADNEDAQKNAELSAEQSAEQSAEKELAAKIVQVMEKEKLYREEKYTITQFATHLGIPEHKLRQIINKEMRHRNFNQFLNGFRIAEAMASLSSSDIPISSIAYEVGFSTLSVFNRAFKEKTGTTPKEYRNSH